jgi:TolB protein
LLDTNGQVVRRLTDTQGQNEHDAHFSPGSNKIAYAKYPDDRSGSSLVLMDLRTGVSEVIKTSDGGIYGIDWSPDGTKLVYTDDLVGGDTSDANIYVINVGSKEVTQMTTDPGWDHMPVWTADGGILFTSYRSGTELMYRVNHASGYVTLFEIKY